MNVLSELSDDQVALIGCGVAFAVCGIIMSLSHYIGQHKRESQKGHHPQVHDMASVDTGSAAESAPTKAQDRKAA